MMAAPTTMVIFAMVLLCAGALLATGDTAKAANDIVTKGADDTAEAAADDLVVDACFKVTNRYQQYGPRLTRSSCEMALWSDKRSASAKHPRDLALVAMDLVQEGAAVAGAKVSTVLSSSVGDAAKLSKGTALSLRYCRLDYEVVAHTVPVCREMVQKYDTSVEAGDGNNMIAYDYLECANKVINAASGCWGRIAYDYETKKAMWKEVNEVANRANLAKAMVENMVGVVDNDFTDLFIGDDYDDNDADNDISDHHRHGHHHRRGPNADDDNDDDDHHHHGPHHRRGPDADADDDDHHRHSHHGHDDDDD